jgi:hypothetical protein
MSAQHVGPQRGDEYFRLTSNSPMLQSSEASADRTRFAFNTQKTIHTKKLYGMPVGPSKATSLA